MRLSLITAALEDAQVLRDLERDDIYKQRIANHCKEYLAREKISKSTVNSTLMHYTIIKYLDPKHDEKHKIWLIEKWRTRKQSRKDLRTEIGHKYVCNRTGIGRFWNTIVKNGK